jgi:hypothetical protein
MKGIVNGMTGQRGVGLVIREVERCGVEIYRGRARRTMQARSFERTRSDARRCSNTAERLASHPNKRVTWIH